MHAFLLHTWKQMMEPAVHLTCLSCVDDTLGAAPLISAHHLTWSWESARADFRNAQSLLLALGHQSNGSKKTWGKILKRRTFVDACGERDVHFLFWQSHGRFARGGGGARVWRSRRQCGAGCLITPLAQSSRLYQKSRHRYNVLVQLFLSDPHPLHSEDAAAAQESYAVAAAAFLLLK